MKKRLILASALLVVGAGTGVMALNSPQSGGADTSPIVQQVNHNTDELANHEARITNTENDVKDLQSKTSTPPSSSNTPVPVVTAPAASQPVTSSMPTPVPAVSTAVTVVSSGAIVGDAYNGYCRLTYSDGSTGYAKATMTSTADGNNISTTDNCPSFVGQLK